MGKIAVDKREEGRSKDSSWEVIDDKKAACDPGSLAPNESNSLKNPKAPVLKKTSVEIKVASFLWNVLTSNIEITCSMRGSGIY